MQVGNWKSNTASVPEAQMFAILGIASGMSNKEIARERGISPAGVSRIMVRLFARFDAHKRSAVVAEAVRQGLIAYAAMFLVFISGTLSIVNDSFDQPRTTNTRISSRANTRNTRLRGRLRASRHDLIDFEFEDMTPESLSALFEAQANRNTLAPWSSVAGTRHLLSQQDLAVGSSSNELRMQLWRIEKQKFDTAQADAMTFGMTEQVAVKQVA